MNSNILSALHFAGDLLSDPQRRTTGTLAEDRQGAPVSPIDPEACRWCFTGALTKSCHELGITAPVDQVNVFVAAKDKVGIPFDSESPVFWDMNLELHDLMVDRLRKAE